MTPVITFVGDGGGALAGREVAQLLTELFPRSTRDKKDQLGIPAE